jgi:hypothetical protein
MAANGYIVVKLQTVAGHGVAWNEQISKDWGGGNGWLPSSNWCGKENM